MKFPNIVIFQLLTMIVVDFFPVQGQQERKQQQKLQSF